MATAAIIPLDRDAGKLVKKTALYKEVLTPRRIAAYPSPDKGVKYYYDAQQGGLCVRITATGSKSFVLYSRVNGRPKRITLGKVGTLSLPEARTAAAQLIGQAAAGADVVAERKAQRTKNITMQELFDLWLAGAKTRGLKTWSEDESLWTNQLKGKLGNAQAIDVTSLDLQRHINKIGKNHNRRGNKATALLSRVFSYAIKHDKFTGANPAKNVDRFPERSRERFLSPVEVHDFINAVRAEDEQHWREFFLLLLTTGARKSSMLQMRWQDIDLINAVWHVPSWASKNGRALALPLVRESLESLHKLKELKKESDWVFPSMTSSTGHVTSPEKPFKRICKRAGLTDFHIHDIRRTAGSWAATNGVNSQTITKILGHKSQQSAEPYTRMDLDPVRQALNTITAQMFAAGGTDE